MGSKLMPPKHPWVQKSFHASCSNYARGVSILLSKSLPCVVETVQTNPKGNYVILVIMIWHQRYVFVGIYSI